MAGHQKQNDQTAEGMPCHTVLRDYPFPDWGNIEYIQKNG